jgi:hypothetical protein
MQSIKQLKSPAKDGQYRALVSCNLSPTTLKLASLPPPLLLLDNNHSQQPLHAC